MRENCYNKTRKLPANGMDVRGFVFGKFVIKVQSRDLSKRKMANFITVEANYMRLRALRCGSFSVGSVCAIQ